MSSRTRALAKILGRTEKENVTRASLGEGGGASVDVFDTLDSLPITGLSAGDQALVEENSRLYISNGSGWYNVSYINTDPAWLTEPSAQYKIIDSATPLTVIAKATDSDLPGKVLINQSFGTDSAQYMANISNDSSVWTFSGKTKSQIADAVAAGNLTDSDGDFQYTFKWSDGISFISKTVNIIYNTVNVTYNPSDIQLYPSGVLKTGLVHDYVKFNNNGTVMWLFEPLYPNTTTGQRWQYWELSTPYDISTATYNHSKSETGHVILNRDIGGNNAIAGNYKALGGFDFNADGTKIITMSRDVSSSPNSALYKVKFAEWTLSTPYDLKTRSYNPTGFKGEQNGTEGILETSWEAANNDHNADAQDMHDIKWADNGNYLLLTQGNGNHGDWQTVKYTTSSPYNFASVDFFSPEQIMIHDDFSPSGYQPNPAGAHWFNPDGTELWTASGGARVRKATFSTPWDFDTVSDQTTTAATQHEMYRASENNGNNVVSSTFTCLAVEPSVGKFYCCVQGGYDQNGNYWNNNDNSNPNNLFKNLSSSGNPYSAFLQFDMD